MERPLGAELNVAGFCVCIGQTTKQQQEPCQINAALLQELICQIRMETGGMKPDVRHYPVNGDKGGSGSTIFQPLTESFAFGMQPSGAMFVDSWTDHGHEYIILASCKPIDFRSIGQWLVEQGYCIIDSFIERLESKPWAARLPELQSKLLRACN